MELKVDFSGRSALYTQEEIEIVTKVMQNADPLTQGKYRDEFEQNFASYIGVQGKCYAVCNATAALELTALLCQFKKGDEIIIPSHTFTASAYPFLKKCAKLVWADVDAESHVVNIDTIRKRVTKKTRAVVVVHLYGYAAEMDPIVDFCSERGITLIEDAAQSIGAEYKGKMTGSFGDFGIFSFQSHKNMTTLGEGGILYVKNNAMAKIVPMLRHNGHCPFPFERKDYWIPAMGNVDMPQLNGENIWPNNYCLGDVECALGNSLLKRIDALNQQKRERAIRFIDSLSGYSELRFLKENSRRHNYHLLVAKMLSEKRDRFFRAMFEQGIKCIVQYYPLNRYDLYKKAGYGEADCPNADSFFDNMVSFPFQHWLTDEQFEYMLNTAIKVLDGLR